MSMGRFVNSMDPRSGLEVIRDWNGVAQVVLRSPKGASARVRTTDCDSTFSCWAIDRLRHCLVGRGFDGVLPSLAGLPDLLRR